MDMTAINPGVVEEYRRTGGHLSGMLEGVPVLLLTTTGRRTGRPHTTPLGYVTDGTRFVVAGSAGGAAADPDWYRNLLTAPSVSIEVGSQTRTADATVATGDYRHQLFERLAAVLPGMADYAARVTREIPVVVLTPTRAGAGLATAAGALRALHRRGDPLVLVNAWDVATAQRVVASGGRAIATSSAAMAQSMGFRDDPSAPVDLLFAAIARIAGCVDVPVTADLLDGYGLDAGELVERLLAAGAVGCNLEDSDHARPGNLMPADGVAQRLAAIRAAAGRAGVDIVINARIDSYLHNGPNATPDVIARARAYLEAGADCVYPVRLTDPAVVRTLVDRLEAPVNANLAGPVTVADLSDAGASRVSIGPMAFHSALAAFDTVTAELLGAR